MRPMILALVVVAVLPASTSLGQLLFADDLNDGNTNGWQQFDVTLAVQNGQHRITTAQFSVAGLPHWKLAQAGNCREKKSSS